MNFLPFLSIIVWLVVTVYLLVLATRFTSAHERMADSLEKIARKQQDDSKP
jgi:hypothetical protein